MSSRALAPACTLLALCAACGGSSQSSAPPVVVASASASTVTGGGTAVADGASPALVTVTLATAAGAPAAGKTVTLASTRGPADRVAPSSGLTDPSGVVTFAVSSTAAGSATLTATDATDHVTLAQTAALTFVPGPVSATASTVVAAAPDPLVADGTYVGTVTVTLRDASGNAVSGKGVSLATSRAAGDVLSAPSGPSDASGAVTFAVASYVAGTGTYTATDDTDALALPQTASLTYQPGPVSAGQSTLAAAPTSVVADGVSASIVTVTVKDAYDNPVPGKSVRLWPGGAQSGPTTVPNISPASATSDPSGVVTFALTTTTSGGTTIQAEDTTDALRLLPYVRIAFTAGPVVDAGSTVVASSGTAFANGATATTVTVTLRDAYGNGVPGKTVGLASSRGATDTISPATAQTDSTGAATFSVGSSTLGLSMFAATDTTDALGLHATAGVTFTSYLAFTTEPSNVTTAATPFSRQPVITLQDASGDVDTAFQGNVTLAIGANPGGGTLSGTVTLPAVNGVVTFTDLSVDKVGQGYTLVATDAADGLPASPSAAFDVVVGPPARLGFTLQPSASGAGIAPSFQVTVEDAGGNPTTASGDPIGVALGANPAGGVLTGTTTATSRSGVATFTGLAISAVGTGYTLVATDPADGLAAATSAPFDVDAPVVVGSGTAGSCTEAALDAALASGGAITFGCGAAPVTITLTATKRISVNTGLDGGGLVTLSGGGTVPLFSVAPGVTLALANLGVTGGVSSGNGGAISSSGALSITGCTVSGNRTASADHVYGTSGNGGAVFADGGSVVVAGSTFGGNTARSDLDIRGTFANGGAVYSAGTLLVTDSTFAGNTASGNNASFSLAGNGGALFVAGGRATVTNATFSGNGAAGYAFDGTAGLGGALYGTATLVDTIVAASTEGGNCSGTFTGDHDLDSDGSCGLGAATDPLLDPTGLGTNGGPTQTIALQAASPAIDAGDQAVCAAAPVNGVDQRGYARPGGTATRCSIGAFEYAAQ